MAAPCSFQRPRQQRLDLAWMDSDGEMMSRQCQRIPFWSVVLLHNLSQILSGLIALDIIVAAMNNGEDVCNESSEVYDLAACESSVSHATRANAGFQFFGGIMSVLTIPMVGDAADRFGRKPLFVLALVLAEAPELIHSWCLACAFAASSVRFLPQPLHLRIPCGLHSRPGGANANSLLALDQRLHYAKRSRQDLCAPVCLPKHGGHRCTSCCQTSQWEDSSGLVGKCKSDSLHLNGQSWKAGHSANGPERIPSLIKHFFRGLRAPSNAETEPSLRDPGAAAGGPTSGDPPNRLSEPVRGFLTESLPQRSPDRLGMSESWAAFATHWRNLPKVCAFKATRSIFLLGFVATGTGAATQSILLPFCKARFGLTSSTFAPLLTVETVSNGFVQLLITPRLARCCSLRCLFAVGLSVGGLNLLNLALAPSFRLMTGLASIAGFGSVGTPAFQTLTANFADQAGQASSLQSGAVLSALQGIQSLFLVLMPPVYQMIFSVCLSSGYAQAPFLLAALSQLICLMILLRFKASVFHTHSSLL
ncbi:unnamed protein product [Effrenium voratum]|nr:unnamed protein product [Effrenium voratum]